jgi:hypothetical protein
MVLICNNSILTIEGFHKNRCVEKNTIRDILIDRKYDTDRFKEEPEKEVKINTTFIKSNTSTTSKSITAIWIN